MTSSRSPRASRPPGRESYAASEALCRARARSVSWAAAAGPYAVARSCMSASTTSQGGTSRPSRQARMPSGSRCQKTAHQPPPWSRRRHQPVQVSRELPHLSRELIHSHRPTPADRSTPARRKHQSCYRAATRSFRRGRSTALPTADPDGIERNRRFPATTATRPAHTARRSHDGRGGRRSARSRRRATGLDLARRVRDPRCRGGHTHGRLRNSQNARGPLRAGSQTPPGTSGHAPRKGRTWHRGVSRPGQDNPSAPATPVGRERNAMTSGYMGPEDFGRDPFGEFLARFFGGAASPGGSGRRDSRYIRPPR